MTRDAGRCLWNIWGLGANDAVRSVFDVIIRPEPKGASQTTPKQPVHDTHYNT